MFAELSDSTLMNSLALLGSGGVLFGIGGYVGARLQRLRSSMQVRQMHNKLAAAERVIREQEERMQSYKTEARTDGLTGLPNRRAFDTILSRRVGERQRRKAPVSLLIIDIDHFKELNDQYGHQAGDAVLRGLSGILSSAMRDSDVVARIGGEEFGAILSHASLDDARAVSERLRASVAKNEFMVHGGKLHLTVSIGAAEVLPSESAELIYKRADSALYRAKETGRNRVVVHDGMERDTIVMDLDGTLTADDFDDETPAAIPSADIAHLIASNGNSQTAEVAIHDPQSKGTGATPHPDSQPGTYPSEDVATVPLLRGS